MGMFDSLYDERGHEWQTKAYECLLEDFRIGDKMPGLAVSYQLEVVGGEYGGRDAYATIRDGHLESVPDDRDDGLPLLDRFGDGKE